MNTEHTITDTERADLRAGLAEARKRGPKLSATRQPGTTHLRCQLFITREEHTGLGLVGTTLALNMGRPVSRAIVTRLALYRLMNDALRSLNDPALAARLKAEALAVRGERTKAKP